MSNKEDIEISSMSYTSKDFGTLYPEILDLAKQLTNKWDPSQSNESDPGVVLLKEAAFVADHNNYNIDKNVLENFLPSATQERSVRNIMEMNGYTPRYYVSASGRVTFTWENPNSTSDTTFTIPAFTLVISDVDQTISYTQVEDLPINIDPANPGKSLPSSCLFVEGTLQTLTVNNSSLILLSNLDDNNRIYLPNSMVAQNGIFIRYVNDTDHKTYGFWERNNYLSTQPSGSRIYKLDYDSIKNLPYIEFPSDISNIIKDGINISYISTSGEAGNVSAGKLTNIVSPAEVSFKNTTSGEIITKSTEYLTLKNNQSFINGKDPETINEMYNSFKKVVGTFNTLVSCNDYANKIYTDASDYVSNCYVTDRRTDYNKALNVVTFDENGTYLENISIKPCSLNYRGMGESFIPSPAPGDLFCLLDLESSEGSTLYVNNVVTNGNVNWEKADRINLNDFTLLSKAMTPYDIVIYALKAFSISDYSNNYPYRALENSFKRISDSTKNYIQSESGSVLGDSKCICHTFNDPDTTDIYCFKNYAPLTVTITPYNKITSSQKEEILTNVYKALSQSFNPRGIEFGDSLDKSSIKTVIINADDRIKDCDVNYSYVSKAMFGNEEEKFIDAEKRSGSYSILLELIAKNVLAGRVCLFEFDEDFTYEYGQTNCEIVEKIFSISSKLPINVSGAPSKNVQSSTSSQVVYRINSTGDNIEYFFNAPNYVDLQKGDLINLQMGASYTLQVKQTGTSIAPITTADKFSIKTISSSSSSVTTTYTATADKTYMISFNSSNGEDKLFNRITRPSEIDWIPEGELVITEISTRASNNEGVENLNYTLKDNEYIQVIYPNYYSDNTYSMYVNYRWESTSSEVDSVIKANIEYTIKSGERLIIQYTNDGVTQTDVYTQGKVIKSSFDISPTDSLTSSGTKKSWTDESGIYHDNDKFYTLASNQTISTRILLQTKLNSSNLRCYWISNIIEDDKVRLFSSNILDPEYSERILSDNEYFIYTNAAMNEIMVLGSGTKLVRTDVDDDRWAINIDDMLTIESISENGLSSNIAWQAMDFSETPFYITEMNIVTLSSGDSIIISDWKNLESDITIGNDWLDCPASITYTQDGNSVILPKVENFYKIKSRLDITSSSTSPQELLSSLVGEDGSEGRLYNGVQEITVNGFIGDTVVKRKYTAHTIEDVSSASPVILCESLNNFNLQTSKALNVLGKDDIDLSLYGTLNTLVYTNESELMTGYVYLSNAGEEPTVVDIGGSRSINVDRYDETHTNQLFEYTYPFFYKNTSAWKRDYLIPIYIKGDDVPITAKIYKNVEDSSGDREYIRFKDYNTDNESIIHEGEECYSMILHGNSMYFLTPINMSSANGDELYLELTWTKDNSEMNDVEIIIVGDLTLAKGLNSKLTTKSLDGEKGLLYIIKKLIADSDKPSTKFYYPYRPDDTMSINLDKYIHYSVVLKGSTYVSEPDKYAFDNPEIMFDINNVANHATICQVDLANSNISVESSMVE